MDLIHLIYNAVDPTQWQDPATTLRQEIGAEAGDFVLLFAARLVEGKGHAFLLESLAQLRENIHLAGQLGASVETVYGEDVPFQTAWCWRGRGPCARIWKPRPRPWAWPTG